MVLGLAAAGDVAARRWAETQLGELTHSSIPDAGATSVWIKSFPFLGRLATSGTISEINLRQDHVRSGSLVFSSVTVDLHRVVIDRDRLFRHREVALLRVGRGSVRAVLTQQALSDALGVPVQLSGGKAKADVGGTQMTVGVSLSNGEIVLSPLGSSPLRLHLPDVPLLPCASDISVLEGRLEVGCTVNRVPPELIRAANRVVPRPASG